MKYKIALILCFVLGGYQILLAQTQLSIAPDFGLIVGEVSEQVFYTDSSDSKLSELVWPIVPAYVYGLKVSGQLAIDTNINLFAYIKTRGDINGALNKLMLKGGVSGQMTDTDWLNISNPNWPQGKTHLSVSDAVINNIFQGDFSIGSEFFIDEEHSFSISPQLGVNYTNYSWTARDGYLQYPPNPTPGSPYELWSANIEKVAVVGESIKYNYQAITPDIRLSFTWYINTLTWLNVETAYSPFYFVFDSDQHLLRNLDFSGASSGKSNTRGDLAWAFSQAITFEAPIIEDIFNWGIGINYRFTSINRNKQSVTYTADTTENGVTKSKGTNESAGTGGTQEGYFYISLYLKLVLEDQEDFD